MSNINFNSYSCPLVAVLSSTNADLLAQKNNLNIADLFAPFCSTLINIKARINYICIFNYKNRIH